MKFFSILLTALSMHVFVKAQTTEDSVKLVINKMFAAMKSANGEDLKSCFADSAILQTVVRDKSGVTKVKNENLEEFVSIISKTTAGEADERISFETVKTDGALAIAWTPYSFYYKGKFSHCGVNSFQLVRLASGWKIQYLIDTRRRGECSPE